MLSSIFPADAEALMKTGTETSNSRLWAGIHFQSDVDAGSELGTAVGELVLEHVQAMIQPQ